MLLFAYARLIRAGFVLAREGAFSLIDTTSMPAGAKALIGTARLIERRAVKKTGRVERLTRALNRLGPTYVKFGQSLATRPDVVGPEIAADLSALQDKMDPFPTAEAQAILRNALGNRAEALSELTPAIAAASIAQVHKAELDLGDGRHEPVAVKILRPGIAQRFRRDLESYYAGARLAERFIPSLRRLRPVSVVETLDHSAKLELDLRFEAAAISEFAENGKEDKDFVLPSLHWDQIAPNILTTSWIEGIPLTDRAAIQAADLDHKALAALLLQSFLRHAIRDGFFHADMHPGNLFALPGGGAAAVDFGIMGRIGPGERRFLAEILYGFIVRDYGMVARRHFEMGYVPADQSIDDFTLAIRSIGEPLVGRSSRNISMARVLGQLFEITDIFHMRTRPELLLLQKTMVLVEGVAREIDPDLDIWTVSEPVVSGWLKRQAGPAGRIEELRDHGTRFMGLLSRVPSLAERAENLLERAEAEQAAPRRKFSMESFLLLLLVILFALLVWRLW